MLTFMTILNTIAIIVIFLKLKLITVSIYKEKTFFSNTLTGYIIWINKFYFRVPVRNKRKTELSEEVQMMIAKYDNQAKLQRLSAIFSWLKTWDEVRQFEKDYEVVDRKIVANLVANFIEKK